MMRTFFLALRASLGLLAAVTLLCGLLYPLAAAVGAQLLFSHKANGSLIEKEGKIIGSELLGQSFASEKYFWGRLSAATPPYNAAASGGSNLGAANPKLLEAAQARIQALMKADPKNTAPIPVDLITASASGLDPHASWAAVEYQIPRVAKARKMPEEELRALARRHLEGEGVTLAARPYVNVLRLNLALDGK